MPGRFPPNLFGLTALSVNSYTAVHMVESGGDVTHLHVKEYAAGAFVALLGVLDGAAESITIGQRARVAATIGVIPSDPAGLVGDHSLYWDNGTTILTYDPSVPAVYTHLVGEGFHFPPIYFNGWLWYVTCEGDTTERRLRRIRCDLTGDSLVSNHDQVDTLFEGAGLACLTEIAYHVQGSEIMIAFPLDGGTPVETAAPGETDPPATPWRVGHPVPGVDSVFLLTSGSEVRAWRFTGPNTRVPLWPSSWADFTDLNGSDGVFCHSLTADGSALVTYALGPDGAPDRGIMRVLAEVQTGPAPSPAAVAAQGGQVPDFIFPRG